MHEYLKVILLAAFLGLSFGFSSLHAQDTLVVATGDNGETVFLSEDAERFIVISDAGDTVAIYTIADRIRIVKLQGEGAFTATTPRRMWQEDGLLNTGFRKYRGPEPDPMVGPTVTKLDSTKVALQAMVAKIRFSMDIGTLPIGNTEWGIYSQYLATYGQWGLSLTGLPNLKRTFIGRYAVNERITVGAGFSLGNKAPVGMAVLTSHPFTIFGRKSYVEGGLYLSGTKKVFDERDFFVGTTWQMPVQCTQRLDVAPMLYLAKGGPVTKAFGFNLRYRLSEVPSEEPLAEWDFSALERINPFKKKAERAAKKKDAPADTKEAKGAEHPTVANITKWVTNAENAEYVVESSAAVSSTKNGRRFSLQGTNLEYFVELSENSILIRPWGMDATSYTITAWAEDGTSATATGPDGETLTVHFATQE